ncbi:hypothetical protein ACXYMT_09480 [Salinimicrobium sp. CAU 1759]
MIYEKIIVLGLSPTAKYVGKEAYLLNIKCKAFDFKKGAGYYSKYFESTEVLTEEQLLLKFKNELLNDGFTYYVCPTSDEWIAFINENSDIFRGTNFKTNLTYLNGVYNLLADKFELLKTSEKVGLNYPASVVFTPKKDIFPDLKSLDFPVFVKPSNRTGLAHIMQGKKGWLINNEEEWMAFDMIDQLSGVELLIQEVIIGEESNIKVLGTIATNASINHGCWVGIKYRQYPYGFGSATLVVETVDEELERITETLVEKTGYSGFFALETKYCDKRKKTYLIEVNTRPGLWFGATTTAGCYFVAHWINGLREDKKDLDLSRFPKSVNKVVWRYLYKDLFIKLRMRGGKKEKLNMPDNTKNSYAVYDRHDLKPFVFDFINSLKKFTRG